MIPLTTLIVSFGHPNMEQVLRSQSTTLITETNLSFGYIPGKSQHRHLFLVRCDKKTGIDTGNRFEVTRDQITGGDWQVLSVLNVVTNSQTELIFFTANKDSPLRRNLYVTSFTIHSPTKAYR